MDEATVAEGLTEGLVKLRRGGRKVFGWSWIARDRGTYCVVRARLASAKWHAYKSVCGIAGVAGYGGRLALCELREDEDPEKPGVGESVVGSGSIQGLRTISERYDSYYMTQAVKCYAFIESRARAK